MRIRLASLGGAFLLLWSSGSATAQGIDETLRFARSLQAEGEYYRAITEYKRVLFLAPPESTAIRESAVLGVGGALYSGAEYARSADWLHAHLADLPEGERRMEGARLMYRALLAGGAGERLLALSSELEEPTAETRLFEGLAHARIGHWREATSTFRELSDDPRYGPAAFHFASLAAEAERAGWKSPRVAAVLGIIPGAGYWYAGHRQTAVASLVVNSVFIGATAQAFRTDQDLLGAFLSLFSGSWYAGNVYGSALAARRHNENLQEELWSRFDLTP